MKYFLSTFFTVIIFNTAFSQAPTITSFTPTSGAPGTTVVLTGTNFVNVAANIRVYFGAAKATVSASTTTSCTVTVPSGASFGPISVTKPATSYTSYSTAFFNPTQNCPDAIGQTSFDTTGFATLNITPYYINYGDIDSDGKPDMVVSEKAASTTSYITIYRNTSAANGAITFATGVTYAVGSNVRNVAIGDLNADGKLDIACLNRTAGTVSILINASTVGTITFNTPVAYLVSSGPGGSGIAIGDLNRDGKPDIAVATGTTTASDSIAVLQNLNTTSGAAFTSGSFASYVNYYSGNAIEGLCMGDIDGDGFDDIVCSNNNNNNISVFRNTSIADGAISFAAKVSTGTGLNPLNISLGDVNADGKLDIAVANNATSGGISIIQNNSTPGVISLATDVIFSTGANNNGRDADITDINGDGKLDVIVAIGNADSVSVFININGTGTINSSFFSLVNYALPVSFAPRDVAAQDLNADGKTDFTTVSQVLDRITIFRNLVNGGPYMTSSSSATICSGNAVGLAYTATPSPTTYSWNTTANSSVTGESTGAQTATSLTNTLTINSGIITPVVLNYTVTPSSTTCPGGVPHPQTVTVTVNPKPIITAMTNTVCSGTAFTSTPVNTTNGTVPAGTTYSWSAPTVTGSMTGGAAGTNAASITGTLTNTTTIAQTATYTITPSANSCPGNTFTLTVTVNPTPVMTSATSTSVCSETALSFALTSGAASTYSWLTSANANVSGETTTATVGSTLNNTLGSSLTTATTVVYTVTPTGTAGSCVGTAQTVTVTVNPLPIMTSGTSTSVCSGTALSFPLTSGAAATYSWLTSTNANVTGETTTATVSSALSNTLVNSLSSATTVVYTVTPTGTAGSCVGTAQNVTVTVNPKPTMSSASSTSVCSGTALSFPLTSAATSTYSWLTSANANVTGETTTATVGSTLNNTLVNSLTTATTVVYTVTPTGTAGSCVGTAQSVAVTVNPKPVMSSGTSTSVCSGTSLSFPLTSGAAATYSWLTSTNANVTGETTTATVSSTLSNTLVSSLTSATTVVYTVTPTGTAGSCVGTAQSVSVTVNPKPVMTSAITYSVCSGVAMNFPLTSGATSTYSWNTSDNVSTTGESVLAQSGATINNTIISSLTTATTLVYTVTPTGTAGACVGNTQNVTVTVNPKPIMTSVSADTVCSGNSVALALTSATPSTYSWRATNNTNVTGESTTSQSGSVITNTVTSTSTSIQTLTYTVTPTSTTGSCVGTAQTVTVTLDNLPPVASVGSDISLCSSSLNLPGNNPFPGTGNWTLLSQSIPTFTTTIYAPTTYNSLTGFNNFLTNDNATLRYTVASQLGVCPNTSDDIVITKISCPLTSAFTTSSNNLCLKPGETTTVVYTDNSSPGAFPPINSWTWTFNGGTPASATGQGPHTITYSYASALTTYAASLTVVDNNSNQSMSTQLITVRPKPSAPSVISGSATVCQNDTIDYSVASILNADSYSWVFPTGASSVNPNNIASTIFSSTAQSGVIKVAGVNTCGAGDTSYLNVTVNQLPSAAGVISGTSPVCQGANPVAYSVGSIANATSYVWTFPAGISSAQTTSSIDANFSTIAQSGLITVKGLNTCGYGTSSTYSVTVNPLPDAAGAISGTSPVCQSANGVSFTISPLQNATSYVWTLPTGATTSSTTESASINFSTTATSGLISVAGLNACGTGTASTYSVTMDPLPSAAGAITGPLTICADSNGVSYSVASIINADGYNWSFPSGVTSVNPNNIALTDFSANASSGVISVSGYNACGNGVSSSINVTVNPLPAAAGVITGLDSVCQGQSAVAYNVTTIPNATSYVWSTPAGIQTIGTNNYSADFANNENSGNISVYGANACGIGALSNYAVVVNPLPLPPVFSGNTMLAPCPLADSMLFNFSTALYAESFNWILPAGAYANGAANNDSINIGFNSVGINDTLKVASVNGCGTSSYSYMVLNLQALTTPYICMVSVDTLSNYNEIYWNKTGFASSDTFLIYRDTANYNYALIGKVPYDSLSMFNDTVRSLYAANGNPNVSSWRYKIAVEDSCGNISAMSPYHQTMFIQNSFGNFSWNHYEIEGETTPVPVLNNYEISRDDFATGTINIIQSLSASSTAYTDVDYLTYQNTADWRVFTNWTISCEPTLRLSNNNHDIQTVVVKSKSNIKNNRMVGITSTEVKNSAIKIYPNPASNVLTVDLQILNGEQAVIAIKNMLGQTIYSLKTNQAENTIKVDELNAGVYFIEVTINAHTETKKVVVEK